MSKKYFWLKLDRNFFKRHDIRIIEEQENGKDYILFYLKLLVESIDHEGYLRFSESIPYDEKMLAIVTNTNVDIVRQAIKIFSELKMMQVMDDRTIYMCEVEKMIGSRTAAADRMKAHRERMQVVENKQNDVTCDKKLQKSYTELEKELELEQELDQEKEDTNVSSLSGSNPTRRDFDDNSFLEEVIKKSDKEALNIGARKVLQFFNNHTGSDYRFIDTNLDLIKARLASGVTVGECWQVIVYKTKEWKDNSEMSKFIRPQTIFNKTKFEDYYGKLRTLKQQERN